MTRRLNVQNVPGLMRAALVFAFVCLLAMPTAAFAEGTQLGLRITDSSTSQGSSDPSTGQPGSTTLGIRVTDSSSGAPLTVTLSFVSPGGSTVASQAVLYNSAPVRPEDPLWAGHRFDDWYYDETYETLYDFGTPLTEDATAYAKWTSLYTVSFDSNEGQGTMESMPMVFGESKNLIANGFVRTGYAFAGWNTQPDGSGDFYADESSVLDLAVTPGDTVTLYAQWSLRISCSVPAAPCVTIDAAGKATGQTGAFVSSTIEPLCVTAIESEVLPAASSIFADQPTLEGVRMVLTPSAGSSVHVPLSTSGGGVASGFIIPKQEGSKRGELVVSFGLALPSNAKLSYCSDAVDIAQIAYAISPASNEYLPVGL